METTGAGNEVSSSANAADAVRTTDARTLSTSAAVASVSRRLPS
jgi:hypothetical protein